MKQPRQNFVKFRHPSKKGEQKNHRNFGGFIALINSFKSLNHFVRFERYV